MRIRQVVRPGQARKRQAGATIGQTAERPCHMRQRMWVDSCRAREPQPGGPQPGRRATAGRQQRSAQPGRHGAGTGARASSVGTRASFPRLAGTRAARGSQGLASKRSSFSACPSSSYRIRCRLQGGHGAARQMQNAAELQGAHGAARQHHMHKAAELQRAGSAARRAMALPLHTAAGAAGNPAPLCAAGQRSPLLVACHHGVVEGAVCRPPNPAAPPQSGGVGPLLLGQAGACSSSCGHGRQAMHAADCTSCGPVHAQRAQRT